MHTVEAVVYPLMPTKKDIVVIGASAGGIEALKQLVARLPAKIEAALFVVVHIPPWHRSTLPEILSQNGPLPAKHAKHNEAIRWGHICVAPPDHHLLLQKDRMSLWRGPKENGSRPAINPLFRTAAVHHGERVAGVILSGSLDDGSAGLWWIKEHRGLAIIQHPLEARYSEMPQNAIRYIHADYVARVAEIADIIVRLSEGAVEGGDFAPSSRQQGGLSDGD